MSNKRIAQYGLLTSMMLVLGLIERQFMLVPGIPGIRLGLSNTVLLYALCLLSTKSAWLLMALKVVLGGFMYAGISGMLYGLAGGLFSMLAMLAALAVGGLSMVGVSVAGAVFHMTGQILMSRVLLGSWAAAVQAPILIVAAVVTGVLTGVVSYTVCRAMARENADMQKRLSSIGLTRRSKH